MARRNGKAKARTGGKPPEPTYSLPYIEKFRGVDPKKYPID